MKPINLNMKLNPVKDKDIIDYMKDKPKTWLIKTALREYMEREMSEKQTKKADASELFGDL